MSLHRAEHAFFHDVPVASMAVLKLDNANKMYIDGARLGLNRCVNADLRFLSVLSSEDMVLLRFSCPLENESPQGVGRSHKFRSQMISATAGID